MEINFYSVKKTMREDQIMEYEITSSGFSLPRLLPMGIFFFLTSMVAEASSFNFGNYLI